MGVMRRGTAAAGAVVERFARRDPAEPANPETLEWYCFTCSFRPWADTGDAEGVTFTFAQAGQVPGVREGDRWVSSQPLETGESASMAAGGVVDAFGNVNGAASGAVTR